MWFAIIGSMNYALILGVTLSTSACASDKDSSSTDVDKTVLGNEGSGGFGGSQSSLANTGGAASTAGEENTQGTATTGGTGGAAGTSDATGGYSTGGTPSTSSECAGVGTTCPAGCAELPVLLVNGCTTEAVHQKICLPSAPTVQAPACGVRTATGDIYRLDFQREVPTYAWKFYQNPLAAIEGFRACDQTEINASNCWPAEEASTQKVTFLVTNTSDADRYLVTSGGACTALGIEQGPTWAKLLLGVDIAWCPCVQYCDSGPAPYYTLLAPGASYSLEWDARDMLLVEQLVACPNTASTTATVSDEHEPRGIAQRVEPGTYRATIGFDTEGPTGTRYLAFRVPGVQPVCPAPSQVTAEFTLPQSGDVVVPVSLP